MEFLRSRSFRIYLLLTLGITLLALVITLLILLVSGSGRDDEAVSPGDTLEREQVLETTPASIDPETLILPHTWETPGEVKLRFFRQTDLPWTVSRLSPWWTPPEEILKDDVEANTDREVRKFLEQIP